MTRRLLICLGAVALLAVVVIGLLQAGKDDQSGAASKVKAPSMAEARRTLAGSPPELAALHRQANALVPGGTPAFEKRVRSLQGRPVVVNGWASWCGPCRYELPVFQAQSTKLGRSVAFLGINYQDALDDASSLLRELPVTYPSYIDPVKRITRSVGALYVPFTVFYDRSGRRTFVHQGPYLSEGKLAQDIRRYAQ